MNKILNLIKLNNKNYFLIKHNNILGGNYGNPSQPN